MGNFIEFKYEGDKEVLHRFSNSYEDVYLEHIEVGRRTPCGAWVDIYGKPKFIKERNPMGRKVNKRYAYPTVAEALNSFIIRKKRQIKYKEHELTCAKLALEIAKGLDPNKPIPFLTYKPIAAGLFE